MKIALLLGGFLLSLSVLGQKSEFFKGVDFDSSYSIIGFSQGYDHGQDSLPGFWFLLDNPDDMNKLKHDWVFKAMVPKIQIEYPPVEIFRQAIL